MKNKKISFYYNLKDADKVAIAGTFNNWDYSNDYFVKNECGNFQIDLNIPPGRHFYKFVINDLIWVNDPSNPNISEDGQNNSSITITQNNEKLIRSSNINRSNPTDLYNHFDALESPNWLKDGIIYELHL